MYLVKSAIGGILYTDIVLLQAHVKNIREHSCLSDYGSHHVLHKKAHLQDRQPERTLSPNNHYKKSFSLSLWIYPETYFRS